MEIIKKFQQLMGLDEATEEIQKVEEGHFFVNLVGGVKWDIFIDVIPEVYKFMWECDGHQVYVTSDT